MGGSWSNHVCSVIGEPVHGRRREGRPLSGKGQPTIDEFDAMFRATFADVTQYCRRQAPNVADADDAVAATYKIAWEKFDEVRTHPRQAAWLYRAAQNVLANQRRTTARIAARVEHLRGDIHTNPDRHQVADVAAIAEQYAEIERLYRAIDKLSDIERELIRLTAFEELSHPEIAEVTGIAVKSVRSRIFRARTRLRAIVAQPDDASGNLYVDLRDGRTSPSGDCRASG